MNAWEEKVFERQAARKETQLEIAQKLKSMNMPVDQIQEATGLAEEEIENL